jgi:hypothetical protein
MREIVSFATLMNHCRIDEFDELVRLIDQQLAVLLPAAQNPGLNTLYLPFHNNYLQEAEIMKPVMASPLTPALEHADRERGITIHAVFHIIETNLNNEFEPERKAAATQLHPIVRAYRGITNRTLTGETSYIRNSLTDLMAPENAEAVGRLDLGNSIIRAGSLNQQLEDFLRERERGWSLQHHGSLKPLRRESGFNFRNLAEYINLSYQISILDGAPSPALEQIIDEINDIFRPFRRSLAHRGVHLPSDKQETDSH